MPVLLVFNKYDLLDEESKDFQNQLIELYLSLDYDCIETSAENDFGLDLLRKKLKNNVSLIAGHSGVGKSTLINILDPELDLPTSEISTFANKGVHTTTFAEMFDLGNNSFIIDSPGINELGLMEIGNEELAHYFPEFRELLNACKFNNCKHINEPNCAVKNQVETGEIAVSRYMSYLSMYENHDNRR